MAQTANNLTPTYVAGSGAPHWYYRESNGDSTALQIQLAALPEQIYVLHYVRISFEDIATAKNETYKLTIGSTVYDLMYLSVLANASGGVGACVRELWYPGGIHGVKNQLIQLDLTGGAASRTSMIARIDTVSG